MVGVRGNSMAKNLFVKVGRAEPHCIGTFPDDVAADGAQAAKSADLERSGVARDRVVFTRADVKGAPKKGKQ